MWVALVPGQTVSVTELPEAWRGWFTPGVKVRVGAHLVMKTGGGGLQPGWLASQADMLAEDWELVP